MNLDVALRHALSRLTPSQQQAQSLEVTLVGTIELQGEGERRRRIGPVVVPPELASPFINAVLSGDEVNATQEFEHAFAQSCGVGYVSIAEVSQLEIVEASS